MALAKKGGAGSDMAKMFEGIAGGEGEEAMPPAAEEEPAEDELPPGFLEAGEEFLDDSLPTEQRLAALKRAIHACTETY